MEAISRRTMITGMGKAGLAVLALESLSLPLMVGCSFTSDLQKAIDLIPTAESMAVGIGTIVTIATGQGALAPAEAALIMGIGTLVKGGLSDLLAVIDAYKSAPSSSKATAFGKVETALTALQQNLANALRDAQVKNVSVQTAVAGVLTLVSGVLGDVEVLLGVAPAAVKSARLKASKNGKITIPSNKELAMS